MIPGCAYRHERNALVVGGEGAGEYLWALAGLLEAARLNDCWPGAASLGASLEAMDWAAGLGLHETLELHAASGLPTYREFVRVRTDQDRAAGELDQLDQWREQRGDGIYEKLDRKRRYYGALGELPALLAEETRLYFRKIDPATGRALFRIVLDRISPKGMIDRLTVELAQKAHLWSREELSLDDREVVHASENLQGTVYRLASQEPEWVFLQLGHDPAIEMESVTRGTIGPLIFGDVRPAGRAQDLVAAARGGEILTASLATASVAQIEDVDNDPLSDGFRLSAEARAEYAEARGAAMWHVLRDRKFAVRGTDRGPLEALLASRGTSNIIYEA